MSCFISTFAILKMLYRQNTYFFLEERVSPNQVLVPHHIPFISPILKKKTKSPITKWFKIQLQSVQLRKDPTRQKEICSWGYGLLENRLCSYTILRKLS